MAPSARRQSSPQAEASLKAPRSALVFSEKPGFAWGFLSWTCSRYHLSNV